LKPVLLNWKHIRIRTAGIAADPPLQINIPGPRVSGRKERDHLGVRKGNKGNTLTSVENPDEVVVHTVHTYRVRSIPGVGNAGECRIKAGGGHPKTGNSLH
jgi:hypothetical protein